MADPALLPCPFCGSDGAKRSTEGAFLRWVTCLDCDADGPTAYTVAEAMDAWNDRAASIPARTVENLTEAYEANLKRLTDENTELRAALAALEVTHG